MPRKKSIDSLFQSFQETGLLGSKKSKLKGIAKQSVRKKDVSARKKDALGIQILGRKATSVHQRKVSQKIGSKSAHSKRLNRTRQTIIECNETEANGGETSIESKRESLTELINKLLSEMSGQEPLKSFWQKRREADETNWHDKRTFLMSCLVGDAAFQSVYCQSDACIEHAVMRCLDTECASHKYLCNQCDYERHQFKPTHARQIWKDGHYNFVSPNNYEQYVDTGRALCPKCNIYITTVTPFISCLLVTMQGRHDCFLPKFSCQCGYVAEPKLSAILLSGYWPGSPSIYDGLILFEQTVLQTYNLLKKESPSLSVRAFLATLEGISRTQNRVPVISATRFADALREYQYMRYELSLLCGNKPMECPACNEETFACHVDGNRKLYRYSYNKGGKSDIDTYFGDIFIASDKDVDAFVKYTRIKDSENTGSMCGESHFKAAKANSKSMAQHDETGLCMICCRHNVLFKAVNMYQGEIFAYPLYLERSIIDKSITFFCQDVVCKYWPWLQRLANNLPDLLPCTKPRPFLSVMHAKAHDWSCQIRYGGRMQDGAGLTSGEELEQVNANFSRYGFTTKLMKKSGRHRTLTNAAIQWNEDKIQKIGDTLAKRYEKVIATQTKVDTELQELKMELDITHTEIKVWFKEIKAIAAGHMVEGSSAVTHEAEYFMLHQQFRVIPQLEEIYDDFSIKDLLALNMKQISKTKKNISRYSQLHKELVEDASIDEIIVLAKGKQELLAVKLKDQRMKLQNIIAAIRQKTYDMGKLKGSSKQRHRLRRQLLKVRNSLKRECDTYNRIALEDKSPLITDPANITENSNLPWDENNTHAFKTKKTVVELASFQQRLKEEKEILELEMERVLLYGYSRVHNLSIQTSEPNVSDNTGRYAPDNNDSDVNEGLLALRKSGRDSWKRHLNHCLALFQTVVESRFSEAPKVCDSDSDISSIYDSDNTTDSEPESD